MVSRMANFPIRAGRWTIFWSRQAGTKWMCMYCREEQQASTMVFEFLIDVKNPHKVFMCLKCAKEALVSTIDKIDCLDHLGPEAVKFIDGV